MTSALRAALLLGGSSIVGMISLLVTAKCLALLVGPSGLGQYALLQSVVDIGVLLAGLGVSISVVRLLADAIQRSDEQGAAAIRRTATVLMIATGGLAAILVLAGRGTLANRLIGPGAIDVSFVPAAFAVPATLLGALGLALLSAYRQVVTIASLRITASLLLALTTVVTVALAGTSVLAVGILLSASWLTIGSVLLLRRSAATARARSDRASAVALLRGGLPVAASSLVGTGVQLLIPILVALRLGTEGAGFYRAATQVSAGYLTFIGASLLQDYYPRLSEHQHEPATMLALMDQQLALVMMLTLPIVIVGIGACSLVIPLLYTSAFLPATEILAWSLLGTMLRLPSWTLSFALLARGRMATYFAVEALAGTVLLLASLWGMELFGLAGLGFGAFASYAVYYPAVWLAVRTDLPLRMTRAQAALLGTVGVALAAQVASAVGAEGASLLVVAALAALWIGVDGVFAVRIIGRRRAAAALQSSSHA